METQKLYKKSGFTLAEITLVIGLILGLAAVITLGGKAIKDGSDRTRCLTNQRKILSEFQTLMVAHPVMDDLESSNVFVRPELQINWDRARNDLAKTFQRYACPNILDALDIPPHANPHVNTGREFARSYLILWARKSIINSFKNRPNNRQNLTPKNFLLGNEIGVLLYCRANDKHRFRN